MSNIHSISNQKNKITTHLLFCTPILFLVTFISCDTRYDYLKNHNITDADTGNNEQDEIELINNIRISASATAIRSGFEWVREAEDSIFTIRDDIDSTCYKAPINIETEILLDIYTTYREQISLSALIMNVRSDKDIKFKISLYDMCNVERIFETDYYAKEPLDLKDIKAGCVKISFISNNVFEICSISLKGKTNNTITPVYEPVENNNNLHRYSGVIEGFYGIPWSNSEREKIFNILNRYGLKMYVYAPKNEEKHRALWRERYTESELKNFVSLNEKAKKNNVDFYYAISPFIDFDYEGDTDLNILSEKLAGFVKSGINHLGIFADDIELEKDIKVNSTLGKRHADIVNRLYDNLQKINPDITLLFVGTVYSDERIYAFEDGEGYLKEISHLNDNIKIFWTGRQTSGASIGYEDVEKFILIIGKRPIIWDNYWANDGGDGFLANLYMSNYEGRSNDFQNYTDGIAINPLIQGSLSRTNLIKFGEWLISNNIEDQKKWAEEEFSKFGLLNNKRGGTLSITYLRLVSDIFNGNAKKSIEYLDLNNAIDSVINGLSRGDISITHITDLLRIFARMYSTDQIIYNSNIDPLLYDELFFPLSKVKYDALAGMYAIQYLLNKINSVEDSALLKKLNNAIDKAAKSRFGYSRKKLNDFFNFIKNFTPDREYKIDILPQKGGLSGKCTSGSPMEIQPFDGADKIELFGLSGDDYSIIGEKIILKINRPGNYSISILGKSSTGTNVVWFNFLCR